MSSSTLEEAFRDLNSYPLEEICKPFRISGLGYWCASFVKENHVKDKDLGFNLVCKETPKSGSQISFLYKEDAEEFKRLYGIEGEVYQDNESLIMHRVDKNCTVPVYISKDVESVRKDISEIGEWYVDRVNEIIYETGAPLASLEHSAQDYANKKFKEFQATIESSYPEFKVKDVDLYVHVDLHQQYPYIYIIIWNAVVDSEKSECRINMKVPCKLPKLDLQLEDVCSWELKDKSRSIRYISHLSENKIPTQMQILRDIMKKFVTDELQGSNVHFNEFEGLEYDVDSNIKNEISVEYKGLRISSLYKVENEREEFEGTVIDLVDHLFLELKTKVENFFTKLIPQHEMFVNEFSDYAQNETTYDNDSNYITIDFNKVK